MIDSAFRAVAAGGAGFRQSLDKAREILNNTIPSDVDEVKVIERPEGGLHLEVTIHRPPAAITGQGKWARVAQRLSEEAPLMGMREAFLRAYTKSLFR